MLAIALVLATALSGQAAAPPAGKHLPLRVFVFTTQAPSPGGIVPEEERGRLDSVRDLQDVLRDRKTFVTLVRSADEADVVVEVVNREEREVAQGGFGGATTSQFRETIVRLRVTYGEKTAELKGTGRPSWKAAAKDAAERLTKWIGNAVSRS